MITDFRGKHAFLSNFYWASVTHEGRKFPTVEHAYQAAKTHDLSVKDHIAKLPDASRAKQVGRRAILRSDWEELKLAVMYVLLKKKFSDPRLATRLRETGEEDLVEMNTWGDKYWGVDPKGEGQNQLGKLLMAVREELDDPAAI